MHSWRSIKPLIIVGIGLMLSGCMSRGSLKVPVVTLTEKEINYTSLTVPEEGGIKFIKYTDQIDVVLGPWIQSDKGIISWYTPSMIGVSPDGGKIAYIARKDEKNNIFIKNTSGGRTTIQRTFRNNVLDVSYSPDGEHLVFTDEVNSNRNILQIRANQGASIQQLIVTDAMETSPVYSPDGNHIYYTQSEYDNVSSLYRYYLWSFNRTTSLKTQYSEGFNPSISPNDLSVVAVCRNNRETGYGEIYTLDLETGQETLILSDSEIGFSSPSISPDGKEVVVVGTTLATQSRVGNLDIYTVKMDGTNLTQLTFHPGHDVSPVWSPDGESIYFLGQRGSEDGSWNVWKMEVKE